MPHHHEADHHDESHTFTIEDLNNIEDYLDLIFHGDMGEGHLENFDQGKGFDFDLISAPLNDFVFNRIHSLYSQLPIDENHSANTFNIEKVPIVNRYFNASLQFRGPPSIV